MSAGFGVMLSYLAGNADSVAVFGAAIGKTIAALALEDNQLRLTFDDGTAIAFYDDGQSCCEDRYLSCDDDLNAFVGATLMEAETRDGPDEERDYGVHETAFLVVTTSLGAFTCVTHNEHNGYYGGFALRVRAA